MHPRAYMDEKGLTARAFAELVGISDAQMSRILRGESAASFDTAMKIFEVSEGAISLPEIHALKTKEPAA